MALNYAEQFSPQLLDIVMQDSLTSPFVTANVNWLGAKTFHFTRMSVSGFKAHSRNGGWNRGTVGQADKDYTVEFDRDIEFLLDKAEVDETNQTASIQNVSRIFQQTQAVPEMDAYFFSKVATTALALAGYHSHTAVATYTKANVYGLLKSYLNAGKIRRYKSSGALIMYVSSFVMDLLEQSTEFTRTINMETISDSGMGIQTRVTDLDGCPVMEVIDDERFYSKFDFTTGFAPVAKSLDPAVEGSFKINVLIASQQAVKTVPKIASIYNFAPGTHTQGDGHLYQNRQLWDTFIFPNGKDGTVDSIYVDVDTAEYGA